MGAGGGGRGRHGGGGVRRRLLWGCKLGVCELWCRAAAGERKGVGYEIFTVSAWIARTMPAAARRRSAAVDVRPASLSRVYGTEMVVRDSNMGQGIRAYIENGITGGKRIWSTRMLHPTPLCEY